MKNKQKIRLNLDESKSQLVPIRPVRDKEEGFVKFVNENHPNIPEIRETIKEYHKSCPPSVNINANHEEILKRYLESIFRSSFDDDAEFYGKLAIHEFQYTYARDICKNLGFTAGSRITDKGIEFLKYLQQKDIQVKQNKLNWWLVTATIILTISTVLQVLIFLIK